MQEYNRTTQAELTEVSKSEPCIHCGKPDWCYRLGDLTVCKRGVEPADGWHQTEKTDKDGSYFYAPDAPLKPIRPASKQEFFYCDRDGNPLIKVLRIDDGEGKKSFAQYHWNGKRWLKGCPEEIRPRIPIYRYQQIRKAIAAGRTIFMVEGEGVADALHKLGIAATTTLGGSSNYRSYGSYLDDLKGADIVLCPDRDQPGLKHMEMVAEDFNNARWLYAPPGEFYWQNLPASGGLDVSDWIADGATKDEILNAINTNKIYDLSGAPARIKKGIICQDNASSNHPLTVPAANEVFTQKAIDALYSDTNWIALDGQLYRWVGTHYSLVSTAAEKARIARWCNSTPVQGNSNNWSYTYAKSSYVDAIWNWSLVSFAVDPALVNPPGINCLNGRITISWEDKRPSWQLAPHNHEVFYTYVSEFEFNPNADPTDCDRLLSCLEPAQRDIFIKTLAASLDLVKIRLFKSRVRALLCKGDGNNGKDSLREAVQALYGGMGVVSATFNDFHQYDTSSHKFTLAKLEHARISWSSENSNLSRIDSLQSLKAAITGDTLSLELKNVNERPMNPRCIFLFNINDMPRLQASLEANESRWAVLTFDKTFKLNADPNKGEIEADPRFKYDPTFLQTQVVPALLNKMLAALPDVAANGIDYSCTEEALQEIRRENNHLLEFCQEVGLDYRVGAKVYIHELWEKLSQWYIDNGIAQIVVDSKGKQKLDFLSEPIRKSDQYVKASRLLHPRFHDLFPKTDKRRDYSHGDYHGLFYLTDLGFGSGVDQQMNHLDQQMDQQMDQQKPLQIEDGSLGSAKSLTLSYALQVIAKLSPVEQRTLYKLMENNINKFADPSDPRLSERVFADPFADPLADPSGSFADPLASPTVSTTDSANGATLTNSSGSNAFVQGNTGITVDNSTKNFGDPNNQKFKVGSKVAHVDPKRESYNWHGTITEINADKAKVHWEERAQRKIRGGPVLTHRLSDLRLI